MAVIAPSFASLVDVVKVVSPDGQAMEVAELLSQFNEVLDDMHWMQANGGDYHKEAIRTGLPTTFWRRLYQGVPQSKATTAVITDTCGMLEAYSTIDKALYDLNGAGAAWRMQEDSAFIESMSQQMAQAIFYSNEKASPAQIMGLAPRFSTVNTANAQNAVNVIDAGGTGSSNTSIWLVVWGPRTVFGLFPKGSAGGLTARDLGEQTVYDTANNPFQAMRSHFKWDAGLTVKDWRYVVRIANIDSTKLPNATGYADLITLMQRALHKVPNLAFGRPAFYMNRTTASAIDIQAQQRTQLLLQFEQDQIFGKRFTSFQGFPIRKVDQILNTEQRVV